MDVRLAPAVQLRDPEVHHLHVPRALDHDVGGLDVAVDDRGRVGVVESGRYLLEDLEGLPERQPPPPLQHRLQRVALDQLQDDEAGAGLRDDVVGRHDVRMVKLRRHLGFTEEALLHLLQLPGLDERFEADPLDRHLAPEDLIPGAKHLPEGPPSQAGQSLVPAPEHRRQGLWRRRAGGVPLDGQRGQLRLVPRLLGLRSIVVVRHDALPEVTSLEVMLAAPGDPSTGSVTPRGSAVGSAGSC